jgi:hypothetical protein
MIRTFLSAFCVVVRDAAAGGAGRATNAVQLSSARPMWCKVATQDASLPQYNAEQTAEGEVLRRVTFNPAAAPSLVLSPQVACGTGRSRVP